MEDKEYSSRESAEIAKSLARVFDTYMEFSTSVLAHAEVSNKRYAKKVLKAILEYKEKVPEEVRRFLDNSEEISNHFKTINKLEEMIKTNY